MQVLEKKGKSGVEGGIITLPQDNVCEKADVCGGASPQCRLNPEEWNHVGWTPMGKEIVVKQAAQTICHPKKRWIYCWQWKHKLGMVFDKDLGVYILPECPHCKADLKKILGERAK